MAWLYSNWSDWQAAGGETAGAFQAFSAAATRVGPEVQNGLVAIEAYAQESAASLASALDSIGFQQVAAYGVGLAGWLPLSSIDELAAISGLNFARIATGGVSNTGLTATQGEMAQHSDDIRTTFPWLDGSGVTVGVISDSYDASASAAGSATQDVSTGDLPSDVDVLADAGDPNQVVDEGRAMLQVVHDVAPGADLAFNWHGATQIDMANAIAGLQNANANIIVDDWIFFAEPIFQDGIIAQAVDGAANNGLAYFSAAGNQARRSYESAFNAGAQVNIGGIPETAHEFNTSTHDVLQRVTIPTGGLFRVSFQWDSPFASAGGTGSANDLNIYLVSGASIVAQGRTNNVGGDAFEFLQFANTTANTQYDLLITHVSGASPGLIKYVDFGAGVTFNEYLTNSTTLFGHANAAGAVSVGAASFLATPEFGTTPPAVEGFSALGGTPILFNTAGTRLGTPIVRQKTDVVGPDGGNTTFFGTDIAGDADSFPNFFGTSAAVSHVAGLAALMVQLNRSLTPADIKLALQQTAIDMDDPYVAGFQTGFDFVTGYGLVNGFEALRTVFQADFNNDGYVNALDIDHLWHVVRGTESATGGEDLNYDNHLNEDDVDYLLAKLVYTNQGHVVSLYGDADLDGGVGGADYTAWRERTGDGWAHGDWDGDGGIGGLDYALWRNQLNTYPTNVGDHS